MQSAIHRLRRPHSKGGGPPVFSHEFIIQNHADIISCVCMVIFMGLIPQMTNPIASAFIFVQYNWTMELQVDNESADTVSSRVDTKFPQETYYQHGPLDILNILFYMLVWVILHAIAQEYIWERTVKRLRLSKTKTSKYYDSGCLAVFYLISVIWGCDFIVKEGFLWNWPLLWEGYPHNNMRLSLKFFMLNQMAFWIHCYPELYFMKTKKDELYSKLVLYTSSLLMIAGAYIIQLQNLAVVLLVLHYSVELLFHACRLLHYHGKDDISTPGFKVWMVLFVLIRILTVFISVLTLWFGLGRVHELNRKQQEGQDTEDLTEEETEEEMADIASDGSSAKIDPTQWVYRLLSLTFILVLQLWVGWTFLSSQLERFFGRQKEEGVVTKKFPTKKTEAKKNDKTNKPKSS